MKKVCWTVVLAVFSIAICCLCLFYVVNVSGEAKDKVNEIQYYVSTSQYNQARKQAQQFDKFWDENHTILSLIIHHDILDEIEESVKLIKTSLENTDNDNQIDFKIESTRALYRIQNLRDSEIPSISNIL